ncbi:hypothetical protein [Mycolicibacter minnesotensis]
MSRGANGGLSRRTLLRGLGCAVPALGVAFAAPRAPASPTDPRGCDDPHAVVAGCVVELPEEFSWTSFATTAAVGGGTSYSIAFTTRITPGPPVPPGTTGYRIDSLSIAGVRRDGTAFSVAPSIGESGARAIWVRADSSLGFVLDVPWEARELVRSFAYTYNVVYLDLLTEIQTCTYVTTMKLADNGALDGGVGAVAFSPPRLAACAR